MRPAVGTLAWRKARMEDAELLWRWINDPETRQNSFSKTRIPYGDHCAWLEGRLVSPTTRLWIFSDPEHPVGQVRCHVAGDVVEIHIAVAPECRGRGYGREMLGQAVDLVRDAYGDRVRLQAWVLEHNVRSIRLFRGCGFREVGTADRAGERTIMLELAGAAAPRIPGR